MVAAGGGANSGAFNFELLEDSDSPTANSLSAPARNPLGGSDRGRRQPPPLRGSEARGAGGRLRPTRPGNPQTFPG